MADITPEQFVEASREQGIELTWEQARDYLEECKRIGENLRTTDFSKFDIPCWTDIANISMMQRVGKSFGPALAERMVVKLVLLRQALDRAETRCASLEHVLEEQHGQSDQD